MTTPHSTNTHSVWASATGYRNAGLSVLPIRADGSKAPAIASWHDLQTRLASDKELFGWFINTSHGVAIIAGQISQGLEIFDFDNPPELTSYDPQKTIAEWRELVEETAPGLLGKLPHISTPRGGLHLYFRCDQIEGNQKLAQLPDAQGKPRAIIETRGEGGYVLAPGCPPGCHPTGKQYSLIQGDLATIPRITPAERQVLLDAARALNQHTSPPKNANTHSNQNRTGLRAGEDFNERGDLGALLTKHGWKFLGNSSAGERWQRPGGTHNSATIFPSGWFYVFSSNADPFQPGLAYSKFGVFAELEYGGDYQAAALALGQLGYGTRQPGAPAHAQSNQGQSPQTAPQPDWVVPDKIDGFELTEFPVDCLPSWLRQFVVELATETQTPVEMAALVSLSVLASIFAPETKVLVRGSWIEPLNLYTLTALPSANRKSAVHQACLRPLLHAEREAVRETQDAITRAQNTWEIQKARQQSLRREIARQKDSHARDCNLLDLELVTDWLNENPMPVIPQYLADDVTPETLATLLRDHGGHLLVASAEGGLFETMAGRYSDSVPNLDVFLKGHAGDTLKINRRGRYEYVAEPKVTLALAVQPDVIQEAAKKPGFRKRGLLGRFLYALPESLVGRRQVNAPAMHETTAKLYFDRILWLKTEARYESQIAFSDEAAEVLIEFEKETEAQLGPNGKLADITDWGGKLIGHTARLAAILHLAQETVPGGSVETEVSAIAARAAIQIARCLTGHALAIFASTDKYSEIEAKVTIIREYIKEKNLTKLNVRTLQRDRKRQLGRIPDVRPVLEFMEAQGDLSPLDAKAPKYQAFNYQVNPHLLPVPPVPPTKQGDGALDIQSDDDDQNESGVVRCHQVSATVDSTVSVNDGNGLPEKNGTGTAFSPKCTSVQNGEGASCDNAVPEKAVTATTPNAKPAQRPSKQNGYDGLSVDDIYADTTAAVTATANGKPPP